MYTFYPELSLKCRNVINPSRTQIWVDDLKSDIFFSHCSTSRQATAWLTGFSPRLPVQWESRWEESAKNSLWQIFCVVDARSYLQYSFAQRTEESPAIHAHGSSVRTRRARAAAVLCYCRGFHSDPWELSFDFIVSFYFYFQSLVILIFCFIQ